jgi:diguanylate cyclase (GGDEF)-like protein/PAS domain S-box-containing protein
MKNKPKPISRQKKQADAAPKKPPSPQAVDERSAELDAARARYFDLYDLAPVGYCTISEQGLIMEVNLTASTMLGVSWGKLVKQLLTRFILKEDQDIYYLHHKQLLDTGEPQACELRIVKKNGTAFWAHLAATVAKDEGGAPVSRVILSDITERKQEEELLKQSEAKYRLLVDHMKDQVFLMDLNLKWTYISPSVEKLLGYTLEELMQLPLDNFLTEKSFQIAMDTFSTEMSKALTVPPLPSYKILLELECRCKDSRTLWIESTLSFIQDKAGKPVSILGEGREITKRKRIEEALRESEEIYRLIFEYSPLGLLSFDEKGVIVVCNDNFVQIIGSSRKKLIGLNMLNLPDKNMVSVVQKALNGSAGLYEDFYHSVTAKKISPVRALFAPIVVGGGRIQGGVGIIEDITERKQAESQREALLEALRDSEKRYLELSIIDDLTQLYNSRHFYAQLEREIERSNRYGQPLTLLLLDLDKFKAFNDTYGHVQGDYVLSRLGHAIKRSMRETDSAYRYGGEEFTVILPVTTSEEGIVTAKRIQKELRKENFSLVAGQEVYMTVSIGLAQYKPKEEIKAFVHRVDQFMYKVKKNGRGKICSDDGDVQ